MAQKQKEQRELAQVLEKAREKDARLLAKALEARKTFDKRILKLQRHEVGMAELVGRMVDPASKRLGQAPNGNDHLRPARLIINTKSGPEGIHHPPLDEIVGTLRTHGIIAEINLK